MRIIAGTKARMTILPPRDLTTRPITDRVKESLFSILQPRIPDSQIADLFCGTGSLGLEALSRGARHALMIDRDLDALSRLKKNIDKLQFKQLATIIKADSFKFNLEKLTPTEQPNTTDQTTKPHRLARPDIVFLDPPYKLSFDTSPNSPLGDLLNRFSSNLDPGALVIVRQQRRAELNQSYQNLHLADRREYGSMALSFLEKIGD